MKVGERIREIRKSKKLSQKNLGDLLGVSQAMVAQYENGDRNPKIEQLQKIAVALDVSIDQFLSSEEQMFSKDTLYFLGSDKSLQNLPEQASSGAEITTHDEDYFISRVKKLNLSGLSRLDEHVEDLLKIPDYRKAAENEK